MLSTRVGSLKMQGSFSRLGVQQEGRSRWGDPKSSSPGEQEEPHRAHVNQPSSSSLPSVISSSSKENLYVLIFKNKSLKSKNKVWKHQKLKKRKKKPAQSVEVRIVFLKLLLKTGQIPCLHFGTSCINYPGHEWHSFLRRGSEKQLSWSGVDQTCWWISLAM